MPVATVAAERRAMLVSVFTALGIGIAAVVWGLVAEARIILFDGGYIILGVGLSWVSLHAVSVVARGPSVRYPYGREALTPLIVLVQGIALLAVLVYAATDAVLLLMSGGSDAAALSLALYGTFSAVSGWLIAGWMHRIAPDSPLVGAEIAHWRSGVALSAVMAVGGGIAVVLEPVVGAALLRYLDPVLVLVACIVLIAVPVRLAAGAIRELLESVPSPAIHDHVLAAVRTAEAEFSLHGVVVRETKIGRRLYVDVEVLVPAGTWDVGDIDQVRLRLIDLLAPLGLDPWVGFHPTANASLLRHH